MLARRPLALLLAQTGGSPLSGPETASQGVAFEPPDRQQRGAAEPSVGGPIGPAFNVLDGSGPGGTMHGTDAAFVWKQGAACG